MARVNPPTITPAPLPAPQRADRPTFSDRVDAFVLWLTGAVAQFNGAATATKTNADDAFASAEEAATQAATAVSAANATAWVSGTVYTVGKVVYSPIDKRSYRRSTAGGGTTDPSADLANWVLLSAGSDTYFYARDERASGVSGGSSVQGPQTRALNTVKTNTIPGAFLLDNRVTLPAGTYRFRLRAPRGTGGTHRVSLFNHTANVVAMLGASRNPMELGDDGICQGEITLAVTSAVSVQHYIANASNQQGFDLGRAVGDGFVEVYAEAEFWRMR